MTAADARQSLINQVEDDAKRDAMVIVRDVEAQAREEADKRARKIIAIAMQRVASELTTESTVTTVTLPNEDMKGRIIGREGRNIRAFEAATGTNMIIDDTPEAVVLSCFDPIRREMARLTLEKLIGDGRIQPARIEEMHEKSKVEVEREIREGGEWAVLEAGITDMHPELVRVLGRLKFRTSYGQNVLKHVVEASHIAGMLASELGTNVRLAKRCDALARHRQGRDARGRGQPRPDRGGDRPSTRGGARDLPRDRGAPRRGRTAHDRGRHHADRRRHLRRTSGGPARDARDLRQAARAPRVRSPWSSTASRRSTRCRPGREVRVMVKPENVDDLQAEVIARDIAKKVEEELQYPGQIRIMVIRELRSSALAK